MCAKSLHSYLTLCDPMDCTLPGSSVHGILQARILEWVAMPSSRDLSNPGIEPASPVVPSLQAGSLSLSHWGSPRHTIGSNSWTPWYLTKGVDSIYPHKTQHSDVCSNFIHNCYKLEATKVLFNRWMDEKLWYIQTGKCYSVLKSYELSTPEKT